MNQRTIGTLALPKGLVGGPFGSSLVGSDYVRRGIPVIRGTNLGFRKYVDGDFVFVDSDKVHRDLSRNLAEPGDLVFTQRGTLGQVAIVPEDRYETYVISQSQMRLRVDPAVANINYLYYACISSEFLRQVSDNAITTGVPHINLGILSRLMVPIPSLEEQVAIAEVVGALDDKIAANARICELIWRHLDAEYDASVALNSQSVTVADACVFHNNRRIPLSSRERDLRPGATPYYGATGVFGSVDSALFNEQLVLVGEDGSVITDDGHPVVQYIWGPAWVNNHAHVLTGRTILLELLCIAIKRSDVRHLVTGAVQPKISMGNLKSLALELPVGPDLLRLEDLARAEMALMRSISAESEGLVALRDTLLPALMSGNLRVKDAEKQLEEVL